MAQANILIAVNTLNVNNVLNQLNQINNVGTNVAKNVKSQLNGLRDIRLIVSVLGVREAISDFIKMSDTMTNTRNRLAVLGGSSKQVGDTMRELKGVSMDTRTDFDLTTRSYARTTNATRALGLSQGENIAITKTLSQAIAVSGATNEEAHATLIQLTQAMASNRLSADEMRSVAEQLPVVLDMIANATHKPRVALKKLGEEGKITAAVMAFSILKAQDDMAAKFAKTMPTIAQSWANLTTQVTFTLDKFNQVTGTAQGVVAALQYITNNMSVMVTVAETLGAMAGVYLVIQIGKLSKAFALLVMENPFLALLYGATALVTYVATHAGEIRHALGIDEGKVGQLTVEQGRKWGPFGDTYSSKKFVNSSAAADYDGSAAQVADQLEHDRKKKIIDQQVMAAHMKKLEKQALYDIDHGKSKKGKHITTFDEAIAPLEKDVSGLTLNQAARRDLDAITDVQDKLNGVLREGDVGYKHLTETQTNYVLTLEREKKALLDKEATDKAVFKYWMDRQEEIKKEMTEQLKRRMEVLDQEQDIRRRLSTKRFDSFTDETEIAKARNMVEAGGVGGDRQSILNRLEIQDLKQRGDGPETARQRWLEEIEGIGKFKTDVDAIFGAEGSIATGFSRALASSIVFHTSFKNAINDLGQTIQVEILQTLIQGMIRMAVLSALGGGTAPNTVVGGLLRANPYGSGKASGGYVSGPRTRIMGYHHGGEYIVNAQATEQNRDVLEAINSGKSVSGGGSSSQMKVEVHNYGVQVESHQMGPNHVRIIARQIIHDEVPGLIAGGMNDANNRVSKSLTRNTTATRSR